MEWLSSAGDADAAIRLINSDGSEAEISGNGTRCVAAHLVADGKQDQLTIRTGAGVKLCELVSRHGQSFEFETALGKVQVSGSLEIQLSAGKMRGTQVSMGNPHFVVFVKEFPLKWKEQAAEIQRQKEFSQSVNVEFVRIAGRNAIEVRFYERGAGETQSSGTGSCASAIAAISAGKVASPVSVHAAGGTQVVRWEQGDVFLRGPVQIICRGEYLAG